MKCTKASAMEPTQAVLIKCTCSVLFFYFYLTFAMYSVEATCYSDSSLRTEDKTSLVPVVVKARIQGRSESGDLEVRVTRTLKGDPNRLDKRDITVTGLDAAGPVRLGTTESRVTECMQNAKQKEKYILFLQETEDEDVFTLQFDGVLNSKEELRVLRKVIERENDSFNSSTASSPNVTQLDNTSAPPNMTIASTSTKHYTGCPKDGYCLNGGECAYLIKLQKYFCFCKSPFIGPRCQVHDPYLSKSDDQSNNIFDGDMQTTLITLGVIFGALLFVAIVCAVAYVRYKSSYYHDKRRELEFQLEEINLRSFEEQQPLRHNSQPHRTDSRHSSHDSPQIEYNSTTNSSPNNSHLLHPPRQQSRHYSLLPVHVQPSDEPSLQRSRSDNIFSQTRTSVV
ncbi:uncharacterized protein [Amphiura filiformis]|uniref:uncharacterized protein n=1 Tax=Amphiura filiformis TaxID=82378 RepID=UPI003B226D17